jgi:acyl-CoA dehydrogenase
MLMDCLAEGRSISLPALSVAAAKSVSVHVGGYARIRKQFKVPIAEMEGVQEALGRIGGNAYIMMSAQLLTNAMLNHHEQPAVISAIMKQQMTDRMREVVNDGMDVIGGAGICNGPSNFLANAYCSIPIAITVEGANILTRSLIQFGQGLTRAHPSLLHIIKAIQAGNDMPGFNKAVTATIAHGATNLGRSLASTVTRQRFKGNDVVSYYESQLGKLAANFALSTDFALLLGGHVKAKQSISGRYADVMSNLYLGYAVLWHYQKFPVKGSEKMVEYAMESLLYDIEEAFHGIFANFPIPGVGLAMRAVTFPTGRCYSKPSDKMTHTVARLITTDSEVRKQLSSALFVSDDPTDRVGLINASLSQSLAADKILALTRKEKRQPTPLEKVVLDAAEAARDNIVQVDSFPRLGKEIYEPSDWAANMRPAYTAMLAQAKR